MSKISITRNTFLEAEELTNFQEMLEDNTAKAVTLSNTATWGILRDYTEAEDTTFKVGTGTNVGTIKIGKPLSRAVGSDGLLCRLEAIDNISISDDNSWYWVRIAHKYRREEKGTVSVSDSGTLSGLGTSFRKVLRGISSDVPVKVRFIKTDGSQLLNSGVYEVSEVNGDLSAELNSSLPFLNESNLKMIVIGSTPINETITNNQLSGLYYYDDCEITLVPEVSADTAPTSGHIANKTFYVARVKNNAGVVSIVDKRTQYWQPNVPGVTDRLSKFENLNDLNNKETSRSNLDVYSKAESDSRYMPSGGSADFLDKNENLNDVVDKTAARSNLDVYSKGQINTEINNAINNAVVVSEDVSIPLMPGWSIPNDSYYCFGRKYGRMFTLYLRVRKTVSGATTICSIPTPFKESSFTTERNIPIAGFADSTPANIRLVNNYYANMSDVVVSMSAPENTDITVTFTYILP